MGFTSVKNIIKPETLITPAIGSTCISISSSPKKFPVCNPHKLAVLLHVTAGVEARWSYTAAVMDEEFKWTGEPLPYSPVDALQVALYAAAVPYAVHHALDTHSAWTLYALGGHMDGHCREVLSAT